MTAIHEILSDTAKAKLTQLALSAPIDMDAPAKTTNPCSCGGDECSRCSKPTVGNIRKPRVTRHQPRLTCTPEELLAAAKAGTANRDGHLNLANITDAELGKMMRAGLLTLVVDSVKASHPEVESLRAAQAQAERDALMAERDERKDDAFVLAGFTAHGITVPELDMRSNGELGLALHELVADTVRSPYDKVRHAMGDEPLDPDTTTFAMVGMEHKRLTPVSQASTEFLTKVEALVKHAKMTEQQAIDFLARQG